VYGTGRDGRTWLTDRYNDQVSRRLTATEAKARILALLDEVEGGDEVEITKHGRTVARLVPASGPNALKASQIRVAMTAASDEELFATGAPWELR
jgi:prevent-host-death family protein